MVSEYIRSNLHIISMASSNLIIKFLSSLDTISKAQDHIGAKLQAFLIWDNQAVLIFNKWVIWEIIWSSLCLSTIMLCNKDPKLHNNSHSQVQLPNLPKQRSNLLMAWKREKTTTKLKSKKSPSTGSLVRNQQGLKCLTSLLWRNKKLSLRSWRRKERRIQMTKRLLLSF